MAETSEGWDGTVDEAGIARILAAAAPPRLVGFTVSPVSGQRRVVLAAGESHYGFIRYETDEAGVFDLAAPTDGRWHLLVQRRDWGTNLVSALTIAGPTTSSLLPATVPASYPAGFADSPGIAADIPLAWIWVRAADTTTVVFPIQPAARFETMEPGLVLVHPTSVSGAGVSLAADGTIVFDNVSNALVDIFGVFSSRFRNYRMISRFTNKGNVGIELQWLNGTAPLDGTGYFTNTQAYVNSSRQDSYSGAGQWMINVMSLYSGSKGGAAVDIYSPADDGYTSLMSNAFATGGVMSNAVTLSTYEGNQAVSGLRIRFPSGAAATGNLKFYGYA